jgi:membrane fusion protein, hemolysin D
VDGSPVRLVPGMAIAAEIQLGRRRVVEFFLSPLLKRTYEALRER